MAQMVPIEPVPNQSFSAQLDGRRFAFVLRDANGGMVVDLAIDGAQVLLASRLVAGTPLIPYRHLEAGNLVLTTDGDALPDYTQFGITQTLVFLSAAELALARADG